MKKHLGTAFIICAIILGWFALISIPKAVANRPKDPPCVVLIGYQPSYVRGPDGLHRQDGLVVTWVDSSAGSPEKVPAGARLSDSMAYYMDSGLEPDVDAVYGIVRMRRK